MTPSFPLWKRARCVWCRYWALCRVFGKPEPLAKVNVAKRMHETYLDYFYPEEVWPQEAAVRELHTQIGKAKGEDKTNPFVYVDLRK